uniref:Uncharacterized protein n=1 Tax=Oryza rufipogon TaxID=4529 RepID=A0A0E0PGY5_ORYRU
MVVVVVAAVLAVAAVVMNMMGGTSMGSNSPMVYLPNYFLFFNIFRTNFDSSFRVNTIYIMRRCIIEFTPEQYFCMILNHERFQFSEVLGQLHVYRKNSNI